MHLSVFVRGFVALLLLMASGLAGAQAFRIASQASDGWPVDVQGSATVQRQSDGILITLDRLSIAARFASGDPLYIAALRFNGDDVTGNGKRTSLLFSERAPVGKWLAPGETLSLQIPGPLFMRQPDWHQNDPRFVLDVVVRLDGAESWIPIATTLHEIKLSSNFSQRGNSDLRESGGTSGTLYAVLLAGAVLAYFGLVRWRGTPRKHVFVGLVFFVFVWIGGGYPVLRYAYSMLWTKASAQVIDSAVRELAPSGKQKRFRYAPVVKYQYDQGAQHFSSTQLQLSAPAPFSTRDEAQAALHDWDRVRVAAIPVPVWINPLDAADAVLTRQLSAVATLIFLLGLVGVFILCRTHPRNGE